jgi:RNA polymerase sigma-B factor
MAEDEREISELALEELLSLLGAEGTDQDAIRAQILDRMTHLIDEVVEETFSHSGFSHEELFRAGYLGLLNATYNVELAIRGEIRQHIRERVNRSQFPRWLKDLNRRIEETQVRLLRQKRRLPTLAELSGAINITEEGIAEIFKAREALNYVSLGEEERLNDPDPVIDITKIKNKRKEPFPLEYRIRIAAALEKLGDLQQFMFKSLFPPMGE